jgi:hypothetical protein
MTKVTKKAKKEFLKKKLGVSSQWALHALLLIFSLQTSDEQNSDETSELNGVGFTGTDANLLSSFAKQYERRGTLSPKQMVLVFKKMPKYWNQILNNSDQEKLEALMRVQ